MNVLVVGRGGREHAIVWSLAKSSKLNNIYCAPGNAGIAEQAQCVDIDEMDFDALAQFAVDNQVDLVIVGPEDPLFAGAVDAFEARGLAVFGPRKNAAIIEGSKVFAKQLMQKYNIPTAAYASFDRLEEAQAYLREQRPPIVIKADGLAAGKGVTVAMTMEEAEEALVSIMEQKTFGDAGNRVVIEQYLQGEEMTILAFVDGETVVPMVPSQDHKPVFDGDLGPNTGGMGTYSPVPHIPQSVVDEAIRTILKPAAGATEGRHFRGVLYAGLMITDEGPKTIEFNCRFGDPETQVILPRLKTDLLEIFLATIEGRLGEIDIEWHDDAAVCVVLTSGGYPGPYDKGIRIERLDEVAHSVVFHAGTKRLEDGGTVTNGGRLLGVTAIGKTIAEARENAYKDAEIIRYDGKHYRTDIALKAIQAAKMNRID